MPKYSIHIVGRVHKNNTDGFPQELLTLPEHLSSPCFSGVRVGGS